MFLRDAAKTENIGVSHNGTDDHGIVMQKVNERRRNLKLKLRDRQQVLPDGLHFLILR